jgi:hypothetical protein
MPVIAVDCKEDRDEDYQSVEYSPQLVQTAQEKRVLDSTLYVPVESYLLRAAQQVESWRSGSNLYFYAEGCSSRACTALALFMVLAELEAVKETGAYFSLSVDEQDHLARQLFYDHYHRLGVKTLAADVDQAIDAVFNRLTQLRQAGDGEQIVDWYGYAKFVQNDVRYAKQVCVLLKPMAQVAIAVPAAEDAIPGVIVLGKKPHNEHEQQQQWQRGSRLLEASSSDSPASVTSQPALVKLVSVLLKLLATLWTLVKLTETQKPIPTTAVLSSNSWLAGLQVASESRHCLFAH